MSRLVSTYQRNESIKNSSDGDNRFDFCGRFEFLLIPAKVFSAGMNGIAQIIATYYIQI